MVLSKLQAIFSRVSSSSLAKSSGIYTISGFINAAIPLFLLPLLTRRLSPSDYGIVAMFQIAVSVVFPLIGMNLEGSISRKYYDKDISDFPSYVGSCIMLVIISFSLVSVIFSICIGSIQKVTQIPIEWLKFVLIVAICQFLTTVLLVIYQIRIKPVRYGIIQVSQSILNVGLTFLFVIALKKTWDGRILSQIITGIIMAVFSLGILIISKQVRINILKADVIHALKFGIPLIPHAIGGMFFVAIDRFFLTNILNLEQTGNFTVSYQLGAIIGIITISFNNAFVPWLFENLNKDDINIKRKIVKLTYLYFIFLILVSLLLLVLFPFIVSIIVGVAFNNTNVYSTFIVFGFVFQGMYYMVTNYITYAHKTYVLALLTISVGLLKIPISYFAISWLGAVGASVSYGFTFFIFFISTWYLSSRVYRMPWFYLFKLSNS